MSGWRSGDIVSASAGAVLLASLLVPWVTSDLVRPRSPIALGEVAIVAWVGLAGALLLAFGLWRSTWTGLVALLIVLVVAFVLFTASIPAHVQGSHPGFGMYALSAGGVLAAVGGVLNAIEREGSEF